MYNNPLIVEKMIDQKLNDLRTEGMRSQMLAQADLPHRPTFHLPDLQRLWCRMRTLMARFILRRMQQPVIGKAISEAGCGN
jgi:hypothetical protein